MKILNSAYDFKLFAHLHSYTPGGGGYKIQKTCEKHHH